LRFSFLGGEPLLNDELPEYLRLARQRWPKTEIRLVTNGLLMGRWGPVLWASLGETDTLLTVSIHSRDPDYLARLAAAMKLIRANAEQYQVRWEKRDSVHGWYRLYLGAGREMMPFEDGSPRASWAACQSRHCVTLQDNALWKCPPAAHLPRAAAKLGLGQKPIWNVPLSYQPLPIDASDEEIRRFFARREEPICGMCPAKLEYFEKSIY
jgi:hypothetical protein